MARNENRNHEAFSLLNLIGSKLGTILSLCTLVTVISTAASYATSIIKNIEILNLSKEYSVKEIEYKTKISELEYELRINKFKLEEYEKQRK